MLSKFLIFFAILLAASVSEPEIEEWESESPKIPSNVLSVDEFQDLLANIRPNFEGFYPRQGLQQYLDVYEEDEDEDEEDVEQPPTTTLAIYSTPTRTRGYGKAIKLNKRYFEDFPDSKHYARYAQPPPTDEFTYSCPTDVQCNNGGCCSLGDFCAIDNGQLGCCPDGSLCDASPIPGCGVSCYGICCDVIHTLIGEVICSPTPGAQQEASGVCVGVEPTSPLFTPPSNNCDLSSSFVCGDECCPSNAGLQCDNATIPGQPFCNIPANICPRGVLNPRDCYNVTTDPAAFITSRLPYSTSTITSHASLTTTAVGVTIQAATNGSTASSTQASGSSVSGSGSATGSVAAKSSSGAIRNVKGKYEGVRWGDCLGSVGGLVVLGTGIGAVLL